MLQNHKDIGREIASKINNVLDHQLRLTYVGYIPEEDRYFFNLQMEIPKTIIGATERALLHYIRRHTNFRVGEDMLDISVIFAEVADIIDNEILDTSWQTQKKA